MSFWKTTQSLFEVVFIWLNAFQPIFESFIETGPPLGANRSPKLCHFFPRSSWADFFRPLFRDFGARWRWPIRSHRAARNFNAAERFRTLSAILNSNPNKGNKNINKLDLIPRTSYPLLTPTPSFWDSLLFFSLNSWYSWISLDLHLLFVVFSSQTSITNLGRIHNHEIFIYTSN